MYYSSASRSLTDFCEVHCLRCVRVVFSTRHLAHYLTLRILICFSLSVFMFLTGCISSERTTREIGLENPRSSSGILVKDPKDNTMDKLIAQFENNWNNTISSSKLNAPTQKSNENIARTFVETRRYPKSAPGLSWPTGMGKLFDLPRLNEVELRELIEDLALALQTQYGYEETRGDIARSVPPLPAGSSNERLLSRKIPQGNQVLRIGCWSYKSRSPRLGIYGAVLKSEQAMQPNPDLTSIEATLNQILTNVEQMRKSFSAIDLEHKIIQLSYIDVPGALNALQGLGIYTIDKTSKIPEKVEFSQLPFVLEMTSPSAESTGLVGKSEVGRGQLGASMVPTLASDLNPDMIASPATRLMVLFHPAHPEQFGRVQELIDEVIDKPARQIYIESMVIEITEGGLKQLGVEWEFQDGKSIITGGSLSTNLQESLDEISNTFFFTGDSTQNLSSEWLVKIRALVVDGKAKILSRPSVLALNNRQASIRIGEDIPIATSQEGLSGNASKISFDFKYVPIGILLNIRPRVTQDGREISMMIDIIVSARKPESDLEIQDGEGRILASAPTVTTRRVQTYARIQNNTPFIIGGLISSNDIKLSEKVPFLGDLPVIGSAFRSESSRQVRNEVIIVLTPYVLPEKLHLSRALPKQNEFLDDEDSELFRRSFRIQARDVIDVSFLYRNERFQRYLTAVQKAIRQDYRLAKQVPFYQFADGRLPAERIIVEKIIYNTLTRVELGADISSEQLFLLTDHGPGRYETRYLEMLLSEMPGCDENEASFFSLHPDKALAISFLDPYESPDGKSLISDPVPELKIVSCLDRKTWKRLLWELNQPNKNGRNRYTILIHRREDIFRLQQSIMVKYVLHINGGGGPEANLRKFIPGRILEIPDIDMEQAHIIDVQAARYFFHSSEHFYNAAIQEIESAIEKLDTELLQLK